MHPEGDMKTILCFGDSITLGNNENGGWVGRLKVNFESKGEHHIVYNLGIPGNHSTNLLERFDTEAASRTHKFWPVDEHMIIIAIGINDTKGLDKPENIQTSPEDFKNNIKELIGKARNYTKEVVFLGITPVNEAITSPYENTFFSNKIIEEYNNIIMESCKEARVLYIDMFNPLIKRGQGELLFDGLHPNSRGYGTMYEIIRNRLDYWLN
jgi:lysophospholipase L1-like esterase